MSGGPGTDDPERFTSNVTLKSLLLRAYGVKDYQLLGPGWLGSERYEIRATVPSAATKEQFNAMLRSLLQERFNLAIHHETKEMSVYELVVGKNGSKLKESNLSVRSPTIDSGSPSSNFGVPDRDGFLQIPPGIALILGTRKDGMVRWTGRMQSLTDLVTLLEGQSTLPVVDRTGLSGKYDFNLAYSQERADPSRASPATPASSPFDIPSDGGLSLLDAVQVQLGLKLRT
jgi:uncharacterized protein (TIGR03435 family)